MAPRELKIQIIPAEHGGDEEEAIRKLARLMVRMAMESKVIGGNENEQAAEDAGGVNLLRRCC